MNQRWQERSPTLRRPVQADDTEEEAVHHTTRVPVRYIPLEQREATAQPRSLFAVDQRRLGGSNRQPFPGSAPSPRFARRPSPYEQRQTRQQGGAQPRLAAPRPRKTRDDQEVYQQPPQPRLYRHSSPQDEQHVPILEEDEEEAPAPRHRPRRVAWTLSVGLGMLAMLLLWYGGMSLVGWWQVTQDDLHYGRPRTYQTDAVVGHHDSAGHPSHFIALNYDSQVEIIELAGGDPTRAKIYLGPPLVGEGSDLIPVTLSFRDVNGDGKLDMLVDIQGSVVIFLNDGGQFRPLKPGEHVQV